MPNKNLKKKKQVEKPVAELEEMPDILREEEAMEVSDDVSGKDEQETNVENKPKQKRKRPQISLTDRDARDKCSLFIKSIKKMGRRQEISNLSKDILNIRMRLLRKSSKKSPILYAILDFADEATAEKNYKLLQGKKCGDEKLVVDFVGKKRKYMDRRKEKKGKIEKKEKKGGKKAKAEELDKSRLFVTGFKSRPTEAELKKLFPKSQRIDIPCLRAHTKPFGFAFIAFDEENLAEEAFESMQELSLVVKYAPKLKRKAPEQKDSSKK